MDFMLKFKGALLGTAVGDSIGRAFEGAASVAPKNVEDAARTSPQLRFTDDTQMTLGVLRSLVEAEDFDGEDMAKHFAQDFDPSRGYGPSTASILTKIKSGERWDMPARLAMGGEGSFGNGAAMRVAPVGLLYHQDLTKVRQVAEASSRITHTHPLGVEGAALHALAVALAVQMGPEEFSAADFLKRLAALTKEETYLKKLKKIEEMLGKKTSPADVARELGNGIEAQNSVPAAIHSFLAAGGEFKGTVLGAIGLGGDTDTIGAMAGAIAGAFQGVGEIPSEWLEKLESREELEDLAERLFLLFVKKTLKGRCDICLTVENVHAYKLDPEGGDDLSNFVLFCDNCKSEQEAEDDSGKPKKHGKYRAVYRKAHGRGDR